MTVNFVCFYLKKTSVSGEEMAVCVEVLKQIVFTKGNLLEHEICLTLYDNAKSNMFFNVETAFQKGTLKQQH